VWRWRQRRQCLASTAPLRLLGAAVPRRCSCVVGRGCMRSPATVSCPPRMCTTATDGVAAAAAARWTRASTPSPPPRPRALATDGRSAPHSRAHGGPSFIHCVHGSEQCVDRTSASRPLLTVVHAYAARSRHSPTRPERSLAGYRHTTDTVLARIQQHIFCARKMELLLHAGADGSTAGLKIDAYHTHHAGS
jgi:hypothetical protein